MNYLITYLFTDIPVLLSGAVNRLPLWSTAAHDTAFVILSGETVFPICISGRIPICPLPDAFDLL